MKEYDYLVWDGEKMISPDYIDRDGVAHWREHSIPSMSRVLRAFSGMVDRHGKRIYAGDIVEYSIGAPWDNEVPLTVRAEVVFGDPFYGCFCVKSMDGAMDATGCLYEYINGLRIIGNIWENPELIKQ